MSRSVLAIDPGRVKCGVAVLAADVRTLVQEVVPTPELPVVVGALVAQYDPTVIMGNGTTSA